MKILLLTSYCGDDNSSCSDDHPCLDCLKMCNIVEIPDDTKILKNYGGWDYDEKVETCRQCGNCFPSINIDQDHVCERCNQENDESMRQMESLMNDGHTYHCACRQIWGDGGCECGKGKENAS